MVELLGQGGRLCDNISRRQMLRVGALAPLGLSLPAMLAGQAAGAAAGGRGRFGQAKRCLMIFMWGGPAHQDTLDMKPNAPANIRGEFKPIASNVPGTQVCEHMPHMAKHIDKLAIIRSVTHSDNNHSTSAHWMMTGHKHLLSAENFGASPTDAPHMGAVLTKLAPVTSSMPTFVSLPERIATTAGAVVPGQNGGRLGQQYDPFTIDQHPDEPDFKIDTLALPDDLPLARVSTRRGLLHAFNTARPQLDANERVRAMGRFYERAANLVSSPAAQRAFDLNAESDKERDRYGRQTFGQGLLLARRLLESGVKLVTVYWHREDPALDTTWDTHNDNFNQLKKRLLPQVDKPIATLLDDLQQRGLLDETLVFWNSEFGRTPKVNARAGRDHWGRCNTVWMAGGGAPGGLIHGSSDKHAAAPETNPVGPPDLTATAYHLLGIDPHRVTNDREQRPHVISHGQPIGEIVGV